MSTRIAVFNVLKPLLWLVFPVLLSGVVLATLGLLASDLPRPAVSGSILLGVLAVVLVLERIAPLHRAWNRAPDRLDLVLVLANRLVDIGVVAGTVTVVAWLDAAGVQLAWRRLWPVEAPLIVQAMLGITLAEGIRYVLHRLSHRPGLLWRVHRTHHEPRRMYTLNGPRLHPGNQLWIAMANTVPMLLLGASLSAVVLAANITVFFVLFQHANLRLPFAGWNGLFATPDVHRLHHRRDAVDGVNYGIVLLIFDRLFGTYRRADREPDAGDIGLASANLDGEWPAGARAHVDRTHA